MSPGFQMAGPGFG